MSFTFNWPRFSDQFHADAIQMLNTALNKGNKPPIIADRIEVVELEMGTQPPDLEIRDIGELTTDQFRGIFRLTYNGDAHLVLKTKVQANPLNHKLPDIHLLSGSRGMLSAKQALVVPMLLRLSHIRLSAYVVLVVSKQKGITLVFKTDPLQHVDINSTFDSIAVIQQFIQREIEGQLRQMFREDLPGIIHRLSQQWVKAKVEAPYLSKRPQSVPLARSSSYETRSTPDLSASKMMPEVGSRPRPSRPHSLDSSGFKKHRSVSGASVASVDNRRDLHSNPKQPPQTTSPDPAVQNEYETFDPTYGLRPEGLPPKSGFKGFSSLFTRNKGLADLTEDPNEIDEDEQGDEDEDDEEGYEGDNLSAAASFDMIEWEDTVPGFSPSSSIDHARDRGTPTPEYETIPAVGGGTITRPRVLHSQSAIHPPPGITPRASSASAAFRSPAISPNTLAQRWTSESSGSGSGSYFPDTGSVRSEPAVYRGLRARSRMGSLENPIMTVQRDLLSRTHPPDRYEFTNRYDETYQEKHDYANRSAYDEYSFYDDEDDDNDTNISTQTSSAPHSSSLLPKHSRRLSVSSSTSLQTNATTASTSVNPHLRPHLTHLSTSPPSFPHASASTSTLPGVDPTGFNASTNVTTNAKVILRPTLNNTSMLHLSTLSHSYHTLSPYTRSLSHFTVRSIPPRRQGSTSANVGVGFNMSYGKSNAGAADRQLIKAKRKRIYKIGGNNNRTGASSGQYASVSDTGIKPTTGLNNGFSEEMAMKLGVDGIRHPRGSIGRSTNDLRTKLDENADAKLSRPAQNIPKRFSGNMPPDFDMEDMDRYFRSYEDLPSSVSAAQSLQRHEGQSRDGKGPDVVSDDEDDRRGLNTNMLPASPGGLKGRQSSSHQTSQMRR